MTTLGPLLLLLLAAGAQAAPLRETWAALAGLPALYVAPGFAFARLLGRRAGQPDAVRVLFDAFWCSLPSAILGLAASRWGGGPWSQLGVAALSAGIGGWLDRKGGGEWRPALPEAFGAIGALALISVWFGLEAGNIARPLDRYWYLAGVEERLPDAGTAPKPGDGWAEATPIGDVEAGLWRLRPGGESATLIGPSSAQMVLAVHAPVGASVSGATETPITVRASPVENPDEGPVWRYIGSGVAAGWLAEPMVDNSLLTLHFSSPGDTTVYVLASQDALWTLHGIGELHHAHYYQLLNMVEQLRWAENRWVTDVQPPLWTMVLAPAVALNHGGQPTANVLHAGVLVLLAFGGILFLREYSPHAPGPAWLLPGAAAVVTGKLLLEPGSDGMPDALYAVAIVAALAGRPVGFGLAAQLLRYPGWGVVFVGTLLRRSWAEAARLTGVVAAAALAFGVGGWLTGALDGWLRTVAWESGPEHWHGNTEPRALLSRAPEFYRIWLIYAGGTPVLALLRWPPGTRVALGTAAVYSLLLCTIDHSPTHYFVPLVVLSSLACGCTAAAVENRTLTHSLSASGVAGLLIFWLRGEILA